MQGVVLDLLHTLLPLNSSENEEKTMNNLKQLHTIFTGQGLHDSVLLDVLEANHGHMENTIETLLEITEKNAIMKDFENDLPAPSAPPAEGLVFPVGQEAQPNLHEEEQKALEELMRDIQPKHNELAKYSQVAGKVDNQRPPLVSSWMNGAAELGGWPQAMSWASSSWLDQSVLTQSDLNTSFMQCIKGLKNDFGENNCFLVSCCCA